MTELLSLTVSEFLDAVAAHTPAPGGGGVAAVATAMAAGLTAMAARFAGDQELVDRAEDLRRQAQPLADADAAAYGSYLAATRLPREPDPERRREAVRRALSEATDVPLRIAEIAAETAEIAAGLASSGNPNLRGDAAAAAALGSAAATTSAILVAENLSRSPADPRLSRAADLAARAQAAAAAVTNPGAAPELRPERSPE